MTQNLKIYTVICLFAIISFAGSCRPAKTATSYPKSIIYLVNIEHLIDSSSKFQGKTIQTKGFFSFGFEDQSLFPAKAIFDSTKNIYSFQTKSFPGLWIQIEDYLSIQDTIKQYETHKTGRLVTIQGVVDTLNTGHMGFFKAAIVKAKIVVESP